MAYSKEWKEPLDLQEARDSIKTKLLCVEEIDLQSQAFKKKYPPTDYEAWFDRAKWRQFYLKQEILQTEIWLRERMKHLRTKEMFYGDYESLIHDLVQIIMNQNVALTRDQEFVVESAKELLGV